MLAYHVKKLLPLAIAGACSLSPLVAHATSQTYQAEKPESASFALFGDWSASTPILQYQQLSHSDKQFNAETRHFDLNLNTKRFVDRGTAEAPELLYWNGRSWETNLPHETARWEIETTPIEGKRIAKTLGTNPQTGMWPEFVAPFSKFNEGSARFEAEQIATTTLFAINETDQCATNSSFACSDVSFSDTIKHHNLGDLTQQIKQQNSAELILEQSDYFQLKATLLADSTIRFSITETNVSTAPFVQHLSQGAWKIFEQDGITYLAFKVPAEVRLTDQQGDDQTIFITDKGDELVKGRLIEADSVIQKTISYNQQAFDTVLNALDFNRVQDSRNFEFSDQNFSYHSGAYEPQNRAILDVTVEEMDQWIDELLETQTAQVEMNKHLQAI